MRPKEFLPRIFARLARVLRGSKPCFVDSDTARDGEKDPAHPKTELPGDSTQTAFGQVAYASYADAAEACRGSGYEQEDLVEVIFQKTRIVRERLSSPEGFALQPTQLLTLLSISMAADTDELHVLDFGGACGLQYYLARAFFGESVTFRWCVVETPAMAARAEPLQSDGLRFVDSIEKARAILGDVHLAHSSGTLQYVPDCYHALAQLLECNARFLQLSRFALTTGAEVRYSVQESRLSHNGAGPLPPGMEDRPVRYPITLARIACVEAMLTAGYVIRLRCDDPSGLPPPSSVPVVALAYLAERLPRNGVAAT